MNKSNKIQGDYHQRINNVFAFIDENLEGDLSLKNISEVAFFSPFHFHRVFKFITNETLNDYVKRRRLEKSALDLLHKNGNLSEIAHRYGFSDNSSYSKAFKKYFEVSPTVFKEKYPHRLSKIHKWNSKIGQAYPDYDQYIRIIENLKKWIKMNAKIDIVETQKMEVAYVTSLGVQNLESAYGKIMKWAGDRGLMNQHTKMITIYHDSFKVTAPEKVRMSASILLNEPVTTNGEIGLATIEAGKHIVGSFEIGLHEFEKSWTGLFLWMNENGYQKRDSEPFEIYHNNFNEHPEKKAVVDFYIPVF
ncbi:AraC family transcriptional regulator [Galbibacter mesophilus]|uniref:AraC family transcriptional regulator n=1 Tax=Galbibacter mesophilus TaxID=379069 RepID=UPI00191D3D9C|nr:AraC family transcriptional regulator [Galbibacter mesophilus]MCM5662377.1 AraC family transcriptional regulator [Galbibacter mesophilus]